MLISCPSCGKRISDRAPACPFCKATTNAAPPAESAPPTVPVESAQPTVPVASAPAPPPAPPPAPARPFPPTDDPTATLPPSALPPEVLAALARPSPVPAPVRIAPLPPEKPEPSPRPPTEPEPAPQPAPAPARVALDAAEHFNAGGSEDALTAADRLLSTEPRNGEALNARAQALFKLGRREEAAHAIVKAIEAAPDSLPSWLNKAVMEHEEGKAKQACRSAMDLVEIAQHTETESPLVDQAREMIAAFEATGAFPNARGYLGWLGIGCASLKAGRPEDALELFDRAIDAASGKPDGFRWKGKALTQLDQMDEALALFDAALEIAPNDPEVHHDRGMAFLILGDTDRATLAFDAALAIDPHHAASLKEKRELAGET